MKGAFFKIAACVLLIALFVWIDWYAGQKFIPDNFRIKDPFFHHAFKRSFSGTGIWCGLRYPVFTNSLGFRDYAVRKINLPGNKKRIVFIGDSFCEGLGYPYEATAVGIFSRDVSLRDAEVLNAAAVSYCPKLYYQKIKYFIEKQNLRFDDLFVFVDVADIFDENIFADYLPSESRSFGAADIVPWLNHNSLIFHSLYTFGSNIKRSQAKYFARSQETVHPLEKEYTARREEWTLDPALYDTWGKKGFDLAERNMERLWEFCRERNIRMHIVVYPWPYQIAKGDRLSLQVLRWRAFAQARGIGFLDLFPVFMDRLSAQEAIYKYFISNDDHWNEAGNALVARALITYYGQTAKE